jgi:hypothetical protein
MLGDQRRQLAGGSRTSDNKPQMALAKFITTKAQLRKHRELQLRLTTNTKAEWERNKESIEVCDTQLMLLKQKTTFVKGVLKDHYISLLRQGTDIRYGIVVTRTEDKDLCGSSANSTSSAFDWPLLFSPRF